MAQDKKRNEEIMRGEAQETVDIERLKYRFFFETYVRLILPILLPVVLFALITWGVAVRSLQRQIDADFAAKTEGWRDAISAVTNELERLNINLSTSPSISRKLRGVMQKADGGIPAQEYETFSAIMDLICSSFVSNLYVDSLYLYFDAGGDYFISSDNTILSLRYYPDTGWYDSYREADVSREAWSQLRTVGESTGGPVQMLTLYRRIYAGSAGEGQGVLVLNIPQNRLNRLLEEIGEEKEEGRLLFVLEEEGKPLFGNEEFWRVCGEQADAGILPMRTEAGQMTFGEEEYVLRVIPLESKDLFFAAAMPRSALYAAPQRLTVLLGAVFVLAVIFCARVALGCARSDARNIERIMDSIERARKGQPAPLAARGKRRDAYAYIVHSVVDAFLQKDYMAVQLAQHEQQEKVLRLTALRAQMNPHFLFNTMETIKWKAIALTGGDNQASDMLENLAQILRYSLEAGGDEVSLQEELDIGECYMAIQRVRYRERFCFTIDMPAALMPARVMKLMFQPLLENCIYHGVKGKSTPTTIVLAGHEEDGMLCMSVRDDGLGMTPQALETVRKRLEDGYVSEGEHIGLYHTNKRLRLIYGDLYGISVDSRPGAGTCVSIRIPLCMGEPGV